MPGRLVELTGCMHLSAPPRLDQATHNCRIIGRGLEGDSGLTILLLLLYPSFRYHPFHIISCNQSFSDSSLPAFSNSSIHHQPGPPPIAAWPSPNPHDHHSLTIPLHTLPHSTRA